MSSDLEKKLNQQIFKQEDEELLFCAQIKDEDEKQKIICLTFKKGRIKVVKVKTANYTTFTAGKGFKMDEVSSIGFGEVGNT